MYQDQSSNYVATGTAKELQAAGITINGKPVDVLAVSILHRFGMLDIIGVGPKPARGKAPAVYGIKHSATVEFKKD